MLDDHLLASQIPVDLIRRHKEQLKREIQVRTDLPIVIASMTDLLGDSRETRPM